MTKFVALALSAFAGMLVAMQPPINSRLGSAIGSFAAAATSFLIGTVALVAVALVAGNNNVGALKDVPWWGFLGGFIGAVFVASSLVTVRTLGAGGVVAATIAGQLTFSIVIDKLGLFGLAERPISLTRVIGVAFLAVGVYLVVRD